MPKQTSPVFMPSLPLDKNLSVPMHRQLYANFRDAILGGQLRAGVKLPSTRELARYFEVSRNTVLNAFEQLLADGFLEGKVGSGTFVTNQAHPQTSRTHAGESGGRAAERPLPSRLANLISTLPARHRSSGFGAFRVSIPALDLFPWPTWSRMVADSSRQVTREQMSYSDPLGLLPFREAVASYLRTARNVRCEAAQVIVVSGSQQALCLAAAVLLEPGDKVWMEDPCYLGARSAFLINGNPIQPVPVDAEGLQVEQGRKFCPDARMVYVTPSHQYSLGVTMSLKRRLELLDWAEASDAWIIEDDYDSEYRYVTRPLSSLQGLSRLDRVIYTGTFSKVLFPSLRVGYMVVPAGYVERFSMVREASDICPPTLFQLALTKFMQEGAFAKHVRRMRSIYAERLNALTECVERELVGRAHIEAADSGMHVVAYLHGETDDRAVSSEAARRGIETLPLSRYYYDAPARQGLILGFGCATREQIRDGVAGLKQVLTGLPQAA
jgi:GntR family transcriptional regulator/MocR family aminotransferase